MEIMFLGYIDPGSGFTIFSLGAWIVALLLGLGGVSLLFFKKFFRFLKNHFFVIITIFLIIVTATAIIIGVIMNKKESRFNKKADTSSKRQG